jgi:nucleoporin NUP82
MSLYAPKRVSLYFSLPSNPLIEYSSSIPSAYVHSLECFISAKQDYLTQEMSTTSKNLSIVYDYQRKYVTALIKQLPPGTAFPTAPRSVLMHPPSTIKPQPLRQGPFLLQPAPKMIEGSFGGDATDITYLAFGMDDDDIEDDIERLGVVLVAYQDGKVDLFFDVEKVEARWNIKQVRDII